jgi:hypothetical protein
MLWGISRNGCFLVRSDGSRRVLSVFCQHMVRHLPIQERHARVALVDAQIVEDFACVTDLVRHYAINPISLRRGVIAQLVAGAREGL